MPLDLPNIPHASTNEKLIVGKAITDLLAAGFTLSVYDGEDVTVERSTDPAVIFPALCSTDEDTLYVYKDGSRARSFVRLIWGNELDVISDYGMSLDDILRPAMFLADELGGR